MSYPQQPYSQPNPMYGQPQRRTNGLSVASLVLGITGFITCGFTSLLAVIFGHVSLAQIRRDGTDGHGMAVAGVVLGWILTGLWLLFWGLYWAGIVSTILIGATAIPATAGADRTRLDVGTQPGDAQVVVLEVTGTGGASQIGTLTYSAGFDIEQESGVPLPYTKKVSSGDPFPVSLIAQNAGQSGTITCRIKVDGKVVREDSGDGPYGVCNIRADAP